MKTQISKSASNPPPSPERLESIALGDGGNPQRHVSNHDKTKERTIPPAQQQAMRKEAIAKVDQRISDIALSGSFSIEQRGGTKTERSKSSIEDESLLRIYPTSATEKSGKNTTYSLAQISLLEGSSLQRS